jgi:hypothetical protein
VNSLCALVLRESAVAHGAFECKTLCNSCRQRGKRSAPGVCGRASGRGKMDLAAFGSMRQGELAARLQLEKSTVSRLVRQMEAHGWIQRNSDRHDGRAVLIRLTRQGRETATVPSPKSLEFRRRSVGCFSRRSEPDWR